MTELDFMTMTKSDAQLYTARLEAHKKALEVRELTRAEDSMLASNSHHHVVPLGSSITEGSVGYVIERVNHYRRVDPECDITLELNSPGGYVFAGWALFDVLREARAEGHHVITIGYGYAASMAGILLQAGSERQLAPNAYLMIHEVSSAAIGRLSEMTDEVELSARLNEQGLKVLAERSSLTVRQIKKKMERREWWLNAEEALKYGFIDSIADPFADEIVGIVE